MSTPRSRGSTGPAPIVVAASSAATTAPSSATCRTPRLADPRTSADASRGERAKARLVEGGEVEFHYCSVAPGAGGGAPTATAGRVAL